MASLDEIATALRNADAAGDTEAATALANAYKAQQSAAAPSGNAPQEVPTDTAGVPRVEIQGTSADEPRPAAPSLRDTITSLMQPPEPPEAVKRFGQGFGQGAADLAGGLVSGAAHLGNVAAAPFQLGQDALQGQPLGTAHSQASDQIDADSQRIAHDPNSLTYGAAAMTPEMLLSGGPVASVGRDIATQLPKLGKFADAAGDILSNAGYLCRRGCPLRVDWRGRPGGHDAGRWRRCRCPRPDPDTRRLEAAPLGSPRSGSRTPTSIHRWASFSARQARQSRTPPPTCQSWATWLTTHAIAGCSSTPGARSTACWLPWGHRPTRWERMRSTPPSGLSPAATTM